MDDKALDAEIKSIESAIRNGEVKKGVYQSQLDDLMPKRIKLENQAKSDYGVPITELQATLDQLKAKLITDVSALSTEVASIQKSE